MSRSILFSLFLAVAGAGSAANASEPEGERIFMTRCAGCHALDENRRGPALRGIVGRQVAGHLGYEYSSGLRTEHFVWDEQRLDQWLQNPKQLVPGARMNARFANADDRRAVIAFLREQTQTVR